MRALQLRAAAAGPEGAKSNCAPIIRGQQAVRVRAVRWPDPHGGQKAVPAVAQIFAEVSTPDNSASTLACGENRAVNRLAAACLAACSVPPPLPLPPPAAHTRACVSAGVCWAAAQRQWWAGSGRADHDKWFAWCSPHTARMAGAGGGSTRGKAGGDAAGSGTGSGGVPKRACLSAW